MKTAIVIGRFQPFHNGHKHLIETALATADVDSVLIIIGSTGCAPTSKDPWTVEERKQMIQKSLPDLGWKIAIASVEDEPYSDGVWADKVSAVVRANTTGQCVLVGHSKDASSFYLKMFPKWDFVEAPAYAAIMTTGLEPQRIDAAALRRDLFVGGGATGYAGLESLMPEGACQVVFNTDTGRVIRLADEARAIIDHERDSVSEISKRYGTQPSIAADMLLYSRSHVLLIRRKGKVGKGTLAMPGGFLDPGERLRDAAIRELKEETGVGLIDLGFRDEVALEPILGDAPGRSMRGRIVTAVFKCFVPNGHKTIKPVASDDAEWADWVAINDLPNLKPEFFSDHYHLIHQSLEA